MDKIVRKRDKVNRPIISGLGLSGMFYNPIGSAQVIFGKRKGTLEDSGVCVDSIANVA